MTNAQITYFLKTAEFLNFTEAAKACSISQPTLSKHIKLLEKDLGFKLIVRDTNSVALTQAGEIMRAFFSEAKRDFAYAVENAKHANHVIRRMIRIGLLSGWSVRRISVLKDVLAKMKDTGVDIEIICGEIEEIKKLFSRRRIDVMVVPEDARERNETSGIGAVELGVSKIVLIYASDSNIHQETLSEDIKRCVVLTVDELADGVYGSGMRSILKRHGLEPMRFEEMESPNAMYIAVEYGLGVMVHPNVIGVCGNIHCRTMDLGEPEFKIYGMYHKDDEKMQEFLSTVEKCTK